MDPTKEQNQICKNATETMAKIRQAFREESMSTTWRVNLTSTENGKTAEEQSQEHARNFL
jgi:hypothetical protein